MILNHRLLFEAARARLPGVSAPGGTEPSRTNLPKVSLPAALLVAGIALSCSTACITSAVVQSIESNRRREQAMHNAAAELQETVLSRSVGRDPIVPTPDPAVLEQLLLRALPVRKSFSDGLDQDSTAVKQSTDRTGRPSYTITATGEFSPFYAEAFIAYADTLRHQLANNPVFAIEVWYTRHGQRYLVRQRQLTEPTKAAHP